MGTFFPFLALQLCWRMILCGWLFSVYCLMATSASNMSLKGQSQSHLKKLPMLGTNRTGCLLFEGSWIVDDIGAYPIYRSTDCPTVIDPEFDCQAYGRPDSDYLKYRWKPANCELPRFSGLDFLVRMRGKTVMFVGDSLGRNQWESLVCMIISAAPRTPIQTIRDDPLSTFKFLDYGLSVSFYRAPYLVDIDSVGGKKVLKLDDISGNRNAWKGADVLSFNTGHWWVHKGSLQGWDVMEWGGTYYDDMDRLVALDRGLRTWANWVDTSLDASKARVFFQGVSPTHYNPSDWRTGPASAMTKNCYGETTPLSGTSYPGTYPDQMSIIKAVIKSMQSPVYLLDITFLSALRKDGHPSIYSGSLSPGQKADPNHSADCSHWCLPGLPDTWNQLFYTALLF